MFIEPTVTPHRFSSQSIGINRHVMFAAQDLEPANMVAVFMGEKNSIQLFRPNAALPQPERKLARAESAIDQKVAVTGGNKRAIPRAPASKHGQTEHAGCLIELRKIHKRKRKIEFDLVT